VAAPEVIFETERLVVRPWQEAEADRLYDILRRWDVARWLGDDPRVLRDRAEAAERIARWRSRYEADPRYGVWALQERDQSAPAGSVILLPLPNGDGEVEVGWHLHPDAWGRGLATEAGRGAIGKGFADGLAEVYAITHLDNAASQAVCRRLGMRDLGVFVDRWYAGESQVFRITRSEWSG